MKFDAIGRTSLGTQALQKGQEATRADRARESEVKMRKTHANYRNTFEELTFQQQARSISMTALQFRKELKAHLRRAKEEGKEVDKIREARLDLLRRILSKP